MSILKSLGFRLFDHPAALKAQSEGLTIARVVQVQRRLFLLEGECSGLAQQWWADLSGRFRHENDSSYELPTVGDWVIATAGGPYDRLQVLELLPRFSLVGRKAVERSNDMQLMAANVDTMFIVSSCNQDWNLRRLERYRLLVDQAGVNALLLVSKSDLLQPDQDLYLDEARKIFPLLFVSVVTGQGLDELRERLVPGDTVMFIGSSGVGKSSLINALFGFQKTETQAIREDDAKGRHTTSSRSLLPLPSGALLLDMPGIRELGIFGLEADDISASFEDVEDFARNCRFRDCSHEQEPGCAVVQAIDGGLLDAGRFRSYRKLLREQQSSEIRQDPRRVAEEKRKWKIRTKAVRNMDKKRW